jgi:hypothetical protein
MKCFTPSQRPAAQAHPLGTPDFNIDPLRCAVPQGLGYFVAMPRTRVSPHLSGMVSQPKHLVRVLADAPVRRCAGTSDGLKLSRSPTRPS